MLLLIRRRALTRAGYSKAAMHGWPRLASPHYTLHTSITSQPTRLVHFPGSNHQCSNPGTTLQRLGSLGDRRRAGIYSSNYRSWRRFI